MYDIIIPGDVMEKIAIISDVHGNLEALKATLEDIKERGCSEIYCIGDIIHKGVHSKECHMVTLKEYLEICKLGNKKSIIELKDTIREEDVDRILSIVKEAEWLDNAIFISFYPGLLVKIRREYKDVKIQFLTGYMNDSIVDFCVQHNFSVDSDYQVMTKEYIDKFHKYGLEVNVYTVNDKEVAERLIDYGIDYITSNILEAHE